MTEQELAAGGPPQAGRRRHPVSGRFLALGAALALGGTTPFARLAYDGGTAPLTLLAVRFLAAALLFALLLSLARLPCFPNRRDLPAFLISGLALTGMAVGYLLSIAYIPVSLAALLLYTFPLMVAAVAPFAEGTRIGPGQWFAFLVAFAGLAAALGPDLGGLDVRGVTLALVAAVSNTVLLFTVKGLTLRGHHPLSVLFIGNVTGLVFVAGLLLLEPPHLASSSVGLSMLAIAAGLYLAGVGISFLAIEAAGPTTTALFLNLEPVVAILLALLLVGEDLSLLQASGVLLVVVAIYLSSRHLRRR